MGKKQHTRHTKYQPSFNIMYYNAYLGFNTPLKLQQQQQQEKLQLQQQQLQQENRQNLYVKNTKWKIPFELVS